MQGRITAPFGIPRFSNAPERMAAIFLSRRWSAPPRCSFFLASAGSSKKKRLSHETAASGDSADFTVASGTRLALAESSATTLPSWKITSSISSVAPGLDGRIRRSVLWESDAPSRASSTHHRSNICPHADEKIWIESVLRSLLHAALSFAQVPRIAWSRTCHGDRPTSLSSIAKKGVRKKAAGKA